MGKSEVNTKKKNHCFLNFRKGAEMNFFFFWLKSLWGMEEEKTGEKGERGNEFCVILKNMD